MELRALPEDELVGEAVPGDRPRLGEARGERVAGHRLHHGVVQRVHEHERRDDPRGLRGVEPGRGQRDVDAPGDLPLGRGAGRRGREAHHGQQERHDHGATQPSLERRSAHRDLLPASQTWESCGRDAEATFEWCDYLQIDWPVQLHSGPTRVAGTTRVW